MCFFFDKSRKENKGKKTKELKNKQTRKTKGKKIDLIFSLVYLTHTCIYLYMILEKKKRHKQNEESIFERIFIMKNNDDRNSNDNVTTQTSF